VLSNVLVYVYLIHTALNLVNEYTITINTNSKQLGMLTLTVEHNYICYYIIGVYDMFRPYMWAIFRLWLDLEPQLSSIRTPPGQH